MKSEHIFYKYYILYEMRSYIIKQRTWKHCWPRRSRGWKCFSRVYGLLCHPINNVIVILLYRMSSFPTDFCYYVIKLLYYGKPVRIDNCFLLIAFWKLLLFAYCCLLIAFLCLLFVNCSMLFAHFIFYFLSIAFPRFDSYFNRASKICNAQLYFYR